MPPLGWQPSRFLADRAEAERVFALAEQLGSVNAAASQLGTTWPSLRKAFTRHRLGMPTPNPDVVRQRAIAAARQRTGQPAIPALDPVFMALNSHALPARERSAAELRAWVRRDEEYAILGANVVAELNSESRAANRPAGPGRSPDGPTATSGWPASAPAGPDRRHAERASRPDRPHQPQDQGGRHPLTHRPGHPDSDQRLDAVRAHVAACRGSGPLCQRCRCGRHHRNELG